MKKTLFYACTIVIVLATFIACKKSSNAPAAQPVIDTIESTRDTFIAYVNGVPLQGMGTMFQRNGSGALDIEAFDRYKGISIRILNYHGIGSYPFTGVDSASFRDSSMVYAATSGSLVITKETNQIIQGKFSFIAGPYNITNGIFNFK